MSKSNRLYSNRIIPSVNVEGRQEWFCLVREGMLGPYDSEKTAYQALQDFINWCREVGASGNRGDGQPTKSYLKHPETMRWLDAGVVDQSKL